MHSIFNSRGLAATAFLALVATFATACGNSNHSSVNNSNGPTQAPDEKPSEARATSVTITDQDGTPIAKAKVLLGQKEGQPFNGNLLTTDASGKISVPDAWNSPLALTIDRTGYVRTTFFGATPNRVSYQVNRAADPSKRYEVRGQTNGYPNLSNDGFIDMALVFPAFSRADASLFNLTKLISPETDTMSVFGQKADLPSNTSLPSQRETYVFPLTFAKPVYRMYFSEQGAQKVVAANVRFNLRDVKGDLENGTPLGAMANKITFVAAGLKDVNVKGASTNLDLPVNQVKFSGSVQVTAPQFDSKFAMLALSVPETSGLYYVADMKRFEPGEKKAIVAPGSGSSKGLVISVLTKNLGNQVGAGAETMSAVTAPASDTSAVKFLPVVDAPKLRSGNLVLDPPRAVSGTDPLLTYAVLSKVEVVQNETVKLEKKSPQWELYASDWVENFDLPDFPSNVTFKGSLRWETTFAAQDSGSSKATPGPAALEKATHVTRSAVDL